MTKGLPTEKAKVSVVKGKRGRKASPLTERPRLLLFDVVYDAIAKEGDVTLSNYWCGDGWNRKMYRKMALGVVDVIKATNPSVIWG